MGKIVLTAPATSANVGPGYDIFSLALKEPRDRFEIELNETGQISISVDSGQNEEIPLKAEENSGGLAIRELLRSRGIKAGVSVRIIKGMPSGCGLGSTGAAASACIYAINRLLGLGLTDNEMIDIARSGEVASGGSPHADNVASALLGGFVLIKSYNPIEVIHLEVPEIPVVIAVIRKSIKTTRGFITYEIGPEKLKQQMAHCSWIIHSLHTKDLESFGKGISVDHIAEPVRAAAIPDYWEIKKEVISQGAFGCTISGGGSSVMAICESHKSDMIADIFQKRFSSNPHFVKVIKTRASNKGIVAIEKYNEADILNMNVPQGIPISCQRGLFY